MNIHKLDVFCIIETHTSPANTTILLEKLVIKSYFLAESEGILVIWNDNNVEFEFVTNDLYAVNGIIKVKNSFFTFFFSAIYFAPKFWIRKVQWELFSECYSFLDKPWLVIGDFDQILDPSEKLDGNPHNISKMQSFSSFLNKYGLFDP